MKAQVKEFKDVFDKFDDNGNAEASSLGQATSQLGAGAVLVSLHDDNLRCRRPLSQLLAVTVGQRQWPALIKRGLCTAGPQVEVLELADMLRQGRLSRSFALRGVTLSRRYTVRSPEEGHVV